MRLTTVKFGHGPFCWENIRSFFSFLADKQTRVLKKLILFLLLLGTGAAAFSQVPKIAAADLRIMRKKEDSLKLLIRNVFLDSTTAGRMRSDSLYIRTLVRSLQVKNSFYYGFDSIKAMSTLFAPDSTFRIFTWQLDFDGAYIRQRGAIQFNTPDGSLKLVPLRDYSEFADNAMDSVRGKDTWIGAVYYNMVKTTYNGRSYYTLFGFDENGIRTNKKWIEVLTFNDRQQPQFGGPLFSFEKDTVRRRTQFRYNMEYKKEAATTLNYDPDMQMILFDHLISETNEPDNPWTMIPDGDYEGFQWANGRWVHVDKVFNQKLKDGEFPMPDPLRDNEGLNDNKKLDERTEKNKAKVKKVKGS